MVVKTTKRREERRCKSARGTVRRVWFAVMSYDLVCRSIVFLDDALCALPGWSRRVVGGDEREASGVRTRDARAEERTAIAAKKKGGVESGERGGET